MRSLEDSAVMKELVRILHAYMVGSAQRGKYRPEEDKKAFELGLINHRSQNHLWTAQALVKLSARQPLQRH